VLNLALESCSGCLGAASEASLVLVLDLGCCAEYCLYVASNSANGVEA
jgi:hypothetical protein